MKFDFKATQEYQAIAEYYGDKTANRSKQPLMVHINDGCTMMLKMRGVTEEAVRAYCVHPLLQADTAINDKPAKLYSFDQWVIVLAMEYRAKANTFLCNPETDAWTIEEAVHRLGWIAPEVQLMLAADKLQNQKDFLTYHYGTHKRSAELDRYFKRWLQLLHFEFTEEA